MGETCSVCGVLLSEHSVEDNIACEERQVRAMKLVRDGFNIRKVNK